MLDKIKDLYQKNPKVFILVGGVVLFLIFLIFNKIFRRDKTPEGVRVAPGVVPIGGGVAPVQQFHEPGIDPGFKDDLEKSFEAINEKMLALGEQMKDVGRDTVIIETIIERVEEQQEDIKDIPEEPVTEEIKKFITPGKVGLPYDVPDVRRTFDELKTALEEDIERTINLGARGRRYLEREFVGGKEGYLAHQKERLRILEEEGREIGHLERRPGRPGGRELPATPARDEDLIARLRADIERVEGVKARGDVKKGFWQQWGGIDAYLQSQRERLQRALGG